MTPSSAARKFVISLTMAKDAARPSIGGIGRWLVCTGVAATAVYTASCSGTISQANTSVPGCDRRSLLVSGAEILGVENADAILIEDGTITWIGAKVDAPAHDRILDADGAMALPGLIDSHVHFDALAAAKHLQAELDSASEIFPITMRQTLASGVTTARTHLSALEHMALMGRFSADDCFPSPRIIVSGPGLLGGAPGVEARLMRGIANPKDGATKIRELAANGAEWAAVHGLTRFSNDERNAIFDAAAASGLKLMADTDDFADLERAIASPIRSGEYLNRSVEPSYPSALVEAVGTRTHELFIVPPVGYYLRVTEHASAADRTLDPSVFLFVDKHIAEEMTATFDAAFDADEYIAGIIAARPSFERKFRQLNTSGATMVIGSDSGSLGQFHDDAIWREMDAWRKLGAAPGEIVDAATRIPSRMLEHDDIGRLSIGARGDVVLYRGEALGGDFARSKVEAVIKGGVIFVTNGQWVGPDAETMRNAVDRMREEPR